MGHSPPAGNTVARGLIKRLPDIDGNEYPRREKIVFTYSKTANSTTDLTIDDLEKLIFRGIWIDYGHRGGVLVDDFKGHSTENVKNFAMGKKYWQLFYA